MERDYTKLPIRELLSSIASVNETRYPEIKAALEQELQARKESGEYQQYLDEQKESEQNEQVETIAFAGKVKRATAIYLIVSAVYALTGLGVNASSSGVAFFMTAIFAGFLVASFVGGVGLLRNRSWGHWVAVVVLGLQVIRFQIGGLAFSFLSLIGVYIYGEAGWSIGITAVLLPGMTLAYGPGLPFWLGINVFVIPLIVYLFLAQEKGG